MATPSPWWAPSAWTAPSAVPASIDFTVAIKEVERKPVAKRGRIPGIIANPHVYRAI
ncbi:MAG: hypothetical protein MUP14_07545 [Dehalococcoidia bacterium]|nr:hypothetical protein [Dehalococcoidia bacterium]